MADSIVLAQTDQSTLKTCIWNGSKAVMKTFRSPDDPRTHRRWENELESLRIAGAHDNIAALLSSSFIPLNLTLRLASGKSLDTYTNAQAHCTLPSSSGDTILRQMSSALAHLHSLALIHDDVKPDNIIWDPLIERAVLIDFGAALHMNALPPGYFNPSGTPAYAPPEFLNRRKSFAGDVWALGVVMLYLYGHVSLPDGNWFLPGVWDEGGDTDMRRWLAEVSGLGRAVETELPMLREMLREDPDARISSAELSRRLREQCVS